MTIFSRIFNSSRRAGFQPTNWSIGLWLLTIPLFITLAACTQGGSLPTGKPTSTTASTTPAPQLTPSKQNSPAYPAPGDLPAGEESMLAPFVEGASLLMTKADPPQPLLRVAGDLPTGCYSLRYKSALPDDQHIINVSLAVMPPAAGINCTDVTKSITQDISLDNLAPGLYQVYLNGVKVGSLQRLKVYLLLP